MCDNNIYITHTQFMTQLYLNYNVSKAILFVYNCVFVFAQVLPDYLKGLLNVVPQGKISEQQFNQFAKLAALQHRAKDSLYTPTMYVSCTLCTFSYSYNLT